MTPLLVVWNETNSTLSAYSGMERKTFLKEWNFMPGS